MLEMVIAFVFGVVCGRALELYQHSEFGRGKEAETGPGEEEIPVTEAKPE
jgi:hypothetical protein